MPFVLDFALLNDSTALVSVIEADDTGRVVRSEDGGRSWSTVLELGAGETVFNLTAGRDDSVWATWWGAEPALPEDFELEPPFSFPEREMGIQVSRDGGRSFTLVKWSEENPFVIPGRFVKRSGDDPLVHAFDGTLWMIVPGANGLPFSIVPWEGSNLQGIITAIQCGDSLRAVIFGDPLYLDVSIWHWNTLEATWDLEFESPGFSLELACDPSGDSWSAVLNTMVLRYDAATDKWRGFDFLFDFPDAFSIVDLAAYRDLLYVSGTTFEDEALIRVTDFSNSGAYSGILRRLPTPRSNDTGFYLLEVDSQGVLWAAYRGVFQFDADRRTWNQVWP